MTVDRVLHNFAIDSVSVSVGPHCQSTILVEDMVVLTAISHFVDTPVVARSIDQRTLDDVGAFVKRSILDGEELVALSILDGVRVAEVDWLAHDGGWGWLRSWIWCWRLFRAFECPLLPIQAIIAVLDELGTITC